MKLGFEHNVPSSSNLVPIELVKSHRKRLLHSQFQTVKHVESVLIDQGAHFVEDGDASPELILVYSMAMELAVNAQINPPNQKLNRRMP
ncbi:hypothetical protein KC362_g50 [Hortaea werneckii]|nr:hypothetical protein KC362_g50 [Hortaea werneckii]